MKKIVLKFGDIDLQLKSFVPYFSFWTGHSQTILGHIVSSPRIAFTLESEVLSLPDGDELFIEYWHGTKPFTLSIYHGLGGDSRADYMQRSAILAQNLGWNVVLVNHRAASLKANAKQSYHSGRGEDAEAVIRWARHRFPNTKQVALGFSMSGSILLNLLTRRYGHEQPDVAIVVNAPLDLKSAAIKLAQGVSRVYDLRFFFTLKKVILQRRADLKFPWIGRTMDIDQIYTAPANHFRDRDDYYAKCSTKNHLAQIQTKVFVLSAKDDPFIDVKDYFAGDWNIENVHLTITECGGHMGYYAKTSEARYGRRWLDHYLSRVFDVIMGILT